MVCTYCQTRLPEGSKFCHECGKAYHALSPTHCKNCRTPFEGDEKFCGNCGTEVLAEGSSSSVSGPVECYDCRHFRPSTSVCPRLPRGGGTHVQKELLNISNDEKKQQIAEAKQKVALIKINQKAWGFRPVMSDFCAAKSQEETFEICEVKNRAKDCLDFHLKQGKVVDCQYCNNHVRAGNPFSILDGLPNNEIHTKMLESLDAEWAVELSRIYHNKGKSRTRPRWHAHCRYHSTADEYVALPYPNVHKDCAYFDPE
ncbi:MAG: zinc ribbon domain-containing protein [Nitrospirales bacterium]|nr:zinc ribbon domain-containing protein [Nitrospirales bacterium]